MIFEAITDFIKYEIKYFINGKEVDIETYSTELKKYKKEKYIRHTESLYEKDLNCNVDYHINTIVIE